MSAVRRLHREGPEEARSYLTQAFARSPYWGPTGRAQAKSWAEAIVDAFDTYMTLATDDQRTVLPAGVASDVQVGNHTVGVNVDVVLLDPSGYVARHILWDVPPLTALDAELQAAPIVAALQAELGHDRVVGVEIWHLRSAERRFVQSDHAIARLPEVEEIVARFLADE
jgi:hypothetical protein